MWYSRLKVKALAAAAITTLLLSPVFTQAQSNNHPFNCGADQYWQEKVKQNPELDKQKMEMLTKLAAQRGTGMKNERTGARIIPVVFHVIHTYGPENIPRQKILDQIKTLNEDYAATNSDLSSVRTVFKDYIGTPGVEFRLATKDPNGNCTDGVERIYSTLTVEARDNVKSLSDWDANKYLNIWVVSSINDYGADGTILGYAQFPWDNNKLTDGIVVRADQVTAGNKTLTHEIGHFLGLMHTFESYAGSGCGNSCTTTGDFMCDTPPSTGPSWGCPSATYNTCTMDSPDLPDMWENFMDYSSCQHMFSKDQVAQMTSVFQTTKRANLITDANLLATGTDDNSLNVVCTPKADFYTTQNVVCEGGSITFKDNTWNATPEAYLWTFENGTPSTSTVKDPVIKFTKAGTYKVKLQASNTTGSSTIEKTAFVTVLPLVSPIKAPLVQDFESFDATGYTFTQDAKGLKWTVVTKASVSGSKSIYLNNYSGIAEESYMFTLPMVDMTNAPETKLHFRIASAQKSSASTDELRVQVSSTCGQNFNTVYYKFGTSLATTTDYYTSSFTPTAEQWRSVDVDLGSYKSVKNLIIRFNVKNRGGNNIYIDDIGLGGTVSSTTGIDYIPALGSGVLLYPNPTNDKFNLSVTGMPATAGEVEIFDLAGRELQHLNGVRLGDGAPVLQLGRQAMNLTGAGIYMVKITVGSQVYIQKLAITE